MHKKKTKKAPVYSETPTVNSVEQKSFLLLSRGTPLGFQIAEVVSNAGIYLTNNSIVLHFKSGRRFSSRHPDVFQNHEIAELFFRGSKHYDISNILSYGH